MSHRKHVILNHLDKPLMVLFWPLSHIFMVIGPTVCLMVFGQLFEALLMFVGLCFFIRFYKRRFGRDSLVGVTYWYLPQSTLKATPPSFIREFVG